jgi:hypothetical protein
LGSTRAHSDDILQAEAKIKQIYEAVRDSVPWDVTCIRTKHTISIHCGSICDNPYMCLRPLLGQYPYRSVQIVLRLYHSPAEVLAGFDIDSPCCAYDGSPFLTKSDPILISHRKSGVGKSTSHRCDDASMQHRGHDSSFALL